MAQVLADRTNRFGTCVTRLSSILCKEAGGINLAQGFPEQDPPSSVLQAHAAALMAGHNQYADMRGLPGLREAVCLHWSRLNGGDGYDPESEALIGCGATEMAIATCLALVNPGDEVMIQAPAYENFRPQILLAGGAPRYYRLSPGNNRLDREELERVITDRCRLIILNTPNNPTGRVFTREELRGVAEFCERHDLMLLSDEVYEHLVWDGREQVSPATLPGMRSRSIVVSSLSKGWRATGWRVGWALAPRELMAGIRRCHDFLTGCAPTAAQIAATVALGLGPEFYRQQIADYEDRRQILGRALVDAGFETQWPEGTYYFFADARPLGFKDSREVAGDLLEKAGVGVVPWPAFFEEDTPDNRAWFRVNFAKKTPTVQEAAERIRSFAAARQRARVGLR